MHVAFSPALGETVLLSAGRTRRSTIRLHFTATVKTLADYEQVASGRVRLQVWSDIPGSGRSAGEWGETEFKPVTLPPSVNEFSLLSADSQPETTTLGLDFSVPASHGQHFSFTYRMVHADGEVKWLGHYGQNGALLLNWTDSDPVIMTKNWVPTPENDSYRWNSDGRART